MQAMSHHNDAANSLIAIGLLVSEIFIFEIVDDDGRTQDHGHPICSPCEPSAQVSSGLTELKSILVFDL